VRKAQSFSSQLHENAIALISLVIAIIALVLNTWRLEQTEKNRNVRQAGFEILKTLGQLQAIVNTSLYSANPTNTDPLQGWTYIGMMNDLVILMPSPVPKDLAQLTEVWSSNWKNLANDEQKADLISKKIDLTREVVLEALNQLH
jgi:hypothetical protein